MDNAKMEELARAFEGDGASSGGGQDDRKAERRQNAEKNTVKGRSGGSKRKASVVTLVVGLVALVAGVAVLVMNLLHTPGKRDAEYLVEVGAWQLINEPSVVWKFTEVGKGVLTTNGHTNDYGFIWAIAGDKLEIETDWLYKLENSYTYAIDQDAGRLVLTEGSGENAKTVTFVAGK